MTIANLWTLLWILAACSGGMALWLAWTYLREATRWLREAVARRRRTFGSVAAAPVAQEFLRSQTHIGRIKRQAQGSGGQDAAAEQGPTITPYDSRWQTRVGAARRRFGQGATWFGRINLLIALLAATGAVRGIIWELQRHPPVPPRATQRMETTISNLALQTTYRVPMSTDAVRAFFQYELALRGWQYCGTQATPGCSNLQPSTVAGEIDVYRQANDHDGSGKTIEIWPQSAPAGQAFVTVQETPPR